MNDLFIANDKLPSAREVVCPWKRVSGRQEHVTDVIMLKHPAGGYPWEFMVGVYRSVHKILTRLQTTYE